MALGSAPLSVFVPSWVRKARDSPTERKVVLVTRSVWLTPEPYHFHPSFFAFFCAFFPVHQGYAAFRLVLTVVEKVNLVETVVDDPQAVAVSLFADDRFEAVQSSDATLADE